MSLTQSLITSAFSASLRDAVSGDGNTNYGLLAANAFGSALGNAIVSANLEAPRFKGTAASAEAETRLAEAIQQSTNVDIKDGNIARIEQEASEKLNTATATKQSAEAEVYNANKVERDNRAAQNRNALVKDAAIKNESIKQKEASVSAVNERINKSIVDSVAFKSGVAKGRGMYAIGASNRASTGVDVSAELLRKTAGYGAFREAQIAASDKQYDGYNGVQKFGVNAGVSLFKGPIDGGKGIAGMTALFGIQGSQATGDAYTGLIQNGKGVVNFVFNTTAAQKGHIIGNGLSSVYNHYEGIYNEDGLLALGGTLFGEFLSGATVAVITGGPATVRNFRGPDVATVVPNKTYSGNVYDPDFVGPVQWKHVYRGDSVQRTEFLSSRAQMNGVQGSDSFLSSNADDALLSEVRGSHGLSSSDSPYIGVSQDRGVAEYFARGPKQDQAGFVSEFRIEQREFDNIATSNYENPQAWFEPNPFIGKPEQEFLFESFIDPKYLINQYQVKP